MKVLLPITILVFLLISSCDFKHNAYSKNSDLHFKQEHVDLGNPLELLFFNNEYHLFYQCKKGNSNNWGHATSKNMIDWQNMSMVVYSDSVISIGSGSVVIDWENSSGFGNENSPIIAFYLNNKRTESDESVASQTVSIAFSNDNGSTWKESSNKESILQSITSEIDDLKVLWHEETQKWIMLVLTKSDILIFSSNNLLNWEYESIFGEANYLKKGEWKHFSFFQIQVEESNLLKWAILLSSNAGAPNGGSGIQYFIGDFDGHSFINIGSKNRWLDNGSDNYAGIGLTNSYDFGKPLFYIGAINNLRYSSIADSLQLSNTFTLPRQLCLIEKNKNYTLYSKPIELAGKKIKNINETQFTGKLVFKKSFDFPLEINLLFDVNNKLHFDFAEAFGLQFESDNGDQITIGYNKRKHIFFIAEQNLSNNQSDFYQANYFIDNSTIDMKIIIDHSSIELFALDGLISITKKAFLLNNAMDVSLFSENGNSTLKEGSIIELR